MKILKVFFISLISLTLLYFISNFVSFTSTKELIPGQKAIIVGATSGIGQALAKELTTRGYIVGITGRRKDRLEAVQKEIAAPSHARAMDVAKPEEAQNILRELIDEMGGVDLVVISAGVLSTNLDWQSQKNVIATNVVGFTAIATTATEHFIQKNSGHLVGISSIAGLRGMAAGPIYSASKAFESNYLEGLRWRFQAAAMPITVTTIEPGLVNTAMGQSSDFWRTTPEIAAKQIADAIAHKKDHAYVTKKWRLIAWVLKICPQCTLPLIWLLQKVS